MRELFQLDLDFSRAELLLGGLTAGIVGLLATLPIAIQVLLGLQVIDFATGLLAASIAGLLNSSTGLRGVAKKVVTWGVVSMAYLLEQYLGSPAPIGAVVAGFYVGVEGLSITENAAQAGIYVPGPLRRALEKLRDLDREPQPAEGD